MIRRSLLFLLFVIPSLRAQESTLLLRYPEVHGDRIVFTYAGDLWSVPAGGGAARRMTSHEGYEYLPRTSPDGRWIAFSAEYGGNMDVYVMPSSGGEPRRLTFHPLADRVNGWTPDGRIAFRSKRSSSVQSFDKLFTISPEGGAPVELPLPSVGTSSFSADGTKIAYNRVATESQFWKRYRGGTQSHVSIFDLRTHEYREIPHRDEGEIFPMWFGEAIYFLSDRDGVMNLHRFDIRSGAIAQLTQHKDYDIKWPSLASDGSGRIAYENGGVVHFYDIAAGTTTRVAVRVDTDAPLRRATTINAQKWLQTVSLSPSGARALIGARGEVFTVPAKEGEVRDLTNTSGARELWPAWSPDGRWIAYASDRTGEYELYVRPQDGSGEERRLTSLGPGFRAHLTWSPDSKKLLFSEISLSLWYVDVDTGKVTLVDRSEHDPIDGFSWSPDSRWIAYAKTGATHFGRLFVHSLAGGRSHPVTDGMSDDREPRFDPAGGLLYFLSRRSFTPRFSDFEKTFNFNATTGIYVIPLRAGMPSPFAPKSDEETSGEAPKTTPAPFRIDLESIERRVVPLPVDPGDYSALSSREDRVFYLSGDAKKTLKSFHLAEREEKTILENVGMYGLDAKGDKVVYRSGQTVGIVETKATAKAGDGSLDLSGLNMRLDRREEWKQIFVEAWRMLRDNFYDPTMRGLDWAAMRCRYEAELPYAALRSDVNFLIGEMHGELGVSHITAYGGDVPETRRTAAGLLGADYELVDGLVRIRKIYRDSPLDAPGVAVREGDYLLAVNGRPLRAPDPVYAPFEETAGRQVMLLVNDKPSSTGARSVVVVPVASEAALRYRDWVEINRRKVDAATNGRCAYIHLPDTSDTGISAFGRQFYAQADKDCLLLDARWNSGGYIPDFFFERLSRRHLEYDAPRYGADVEVQEPAILGPKVLVINEYAGSGGDSVADYFRKYGLGPIVGMRTWGGLLGIGDELPMIDGGRVTVPNVSAWDVVDGKSVWIVENRGVVPDIEVDNRPDLLLQGRDPQLERGLEILREQLAKSPPVKPRRPPYPATFE